MQAHLARRLGVLAVAGVIAVTVGGSAAAHPDSAAAPKAGFTLTVGTTLSLTGDGAVFGPAFQKSAEMAVNLANKALARDGIKDTTIKIESADDGSTPTSAVNAARTGVPASTTVMCGAKRTALASSRSSTAASVIQASAPTRCCQAEKSIADACA